MKKYFYIFILLFNFAANAQSQVYILSIDGTINPAASDYIVMGINKANEENAECIIVKLNTPGGLLKSTRVIVSEFLSSKVPVIVYVTPGGAQAASAGVFITMAANIAAMAPGTNIGAAHPVSSQGQMDSTMSEKVTNDAAAFIRTISEKRKRNIKWAEEAVRESVSITENEAVKKNVVNLIAKNIPDLLEKINGEKVETSDGEKILNTENVKIVDYDMNFSQKLLNVLSDPNISYILFMLGLYGLLFEIFSPGAIFPGVIGGICIILAFYAMHTLPINYAGLALIIFAVILFVLEIKIVSHGILMLGGIISLILGSIMLIDVKSMWGVLKISWEAIAMIVTITILFFFVIVGLGIKAQRKKPSTGEEGIVGEFGKAISDLNPNGLVRVHGEIWDAETSDAKIETGSRIVVEQVNKLKLKVKKV
ncbi:MAG: nodulation protein NfeD [Ignavibacteriaceae bacterium]